MPLFNGIIYDVLYSFEPKRGEILFLLLLNGIRKKYVYTWVKKKGKFRCASFEWYTEVKKKYDVIFWMKKKKKTFYASLGCAVLYGVKLWKHEC